jgi:peptide chain release factor 2
LWDDPEAAQAVMQELAEMKEEVDLWAALAQRVGDSLILLEMAEAEGDEAVMDEIAQEAQELEAELERREFQLLLSGEHDKKDAILAIHAGAGGTESQDWAQMLLRMYLRWAEGRGYGTRVLDTMPGEEAGLKSVTAEIDGPYAYGYLKAERGVHRLVRLSPFDAAHRRHTSFAKVEVLPTIDEAVHVEIDPHDLRIETFRSSGPGGQHMQKTSSAVRIVHEPTGIVATCQNERSQSQNRETAMKVLRARLYELEQEKREEEHVRLKGEHVAMGWGNQIRSYVLHPYHMVKDHRTGYETARAEGVLDGDLEGFMEAYLKMEMGGES